MNPELAALQQAIQVLHQLMTVLKDPGAVQTVAKCLQALTGIQQSMMQDQGQQPRQAVVQQLGGQQQQGGGQGGY